MLPSVSAAVALCVGWSASAEAGAMFYDINSLLFEPSPVDARGPPPPRRPAPLYQPPPFSPPARVPRPAVGPQPVVAPPPPPAVRPTAPQDGAFLAFSVGAFDIGSDDVTAELGVEYRMDEIGYNVGPMFGVMVNADASVYVYGGLFLDLDFGNWVVTPSFAVGAYREGKDTDDRYGLDFRSGVELAYRLANRSRLGIAVHHLSNLDLAGNNPNANSLVVTYAIPFDRR